MRDFFLRAFLDGNLVAGRDGIIDGGDWSGHVEGDFVFVGDYGDSVGADFVRSVAIAGDAVRADNHGSDATGFEEMSDHVVSNQGERDAILVKLPSSEACALQVRTCFRDDHFDPVAAFDGHANHSEGSADSSGGEGAGVALSHHATGFGEKFGAKAPDIFVTLTALFVDFQSFVHEGYADLVQACGAIFRGVQCELLEAQLKT